MSEAYIHDGYTADGYLAEYPRLFPAVRFTYRPLLAGKRAQIAALMASQDPSKAQTSAADVIAKQIDRWDLVKHDGQPVPLETAHVVRLQPTLLTMLFRIVMGDMAPDEDPKAAAVVSAQNADRELTAILEGNSPEESDAKN